MTKKLIKGLFIVLFTIVIFLPVLYIKYYNWLFYCFFIILFLILLILLILSFNNKINKKKKILENLLYYDQVTGLPNKNKFLNDLNIIKTTKDNYCVVVFDIINFKNFVDLNNLNETNKFLKFISKVIAEEMKDKEICANIYDDHFAFLLKYEEKNSIIERIKLINDKIVTYNKNLSINLSFGVYLITDKRFSATLIFNKANIARKSIIEKYDTLYAFYDDELKKSNIEISDIENYMEQSLNDKDFMIYYQPKYNLQRKKLIGMEALVRWMHPKKGFLFPEVFIPIFEKNGFIKKIDFYVLEEVCKNIKKWQKNKKKLVPISINISRVNLKNYRLIEEIDFYVSKYEIPHNLLEFEFTESVIFNDVAGFINIIKTLKKDGYKVSIDDFGAGHSSLNILKNLPADILKIDKEFLTGNSKKGNIIIANTIKLAKELNMKVIIEGVENKEQVKLLKDMGCDYGQGYYYSKPLSIKEIEKLLK
ncbi:MAG: GGDEF domain-containing phosphodiesterase [Bacilli bacterium]